MRTIGNIFCLRLFKKETPDVICHALRFCRTDPGHEECHVYPLPNKSIKNRLVFFKNRLIRNNINIPLVKDNPCEMSIFKSICDYINK